MKTNVLLALRPRLLTRTTLAASRDQRPVAAPPAPGDRRGWRGRFLAWVGALGLAAGAGVLHAAEDEAVFADSFEGQLGPGWSWLREAGADWCVRDGGLEIHVRPGDARTVQNALVRAAPDRRAGAFAIEVTVRNWTRPIQQFEQAGITWYHDGQPAMKLVKELVDGQLMIIPGRKGMTNETVQLRLVVTAHSYTAQFRPDAAGEFQTAATGKLPPPGNDQVSLQCYHGPTHAEHWIRFDDFRIVKLSE
ncbi:MAG: hypothetical protein FJ387_12175 [Verrucomicrobia bacterium]|nr:hypothetical protein [Verrucomicrobiota bacterium]